MNKNREEVFESLIREYMKSEKVQEMEAYIQHGNTTTLEHCENVAKISFLMNDIFHLNADQKALVVAAMLHDFYLYDWHDGEPERKTHGFDHPEIACNNAVQYFQVDEKVQESIKSHMWPLTLTQVPKSREALILCLADKYCALLETLSFGKKVCI